MLGGIFKNIFSKKKSKKPEDSGKKIAVSLKNKSENIAGFFGKKIEQAKSDFFSIKDKCNNLLGTNYNLGLKHLESGHLNEAIFRFRFVKKFWPHHLESHYQLAYCLVLKNKFTDSKKILENLIAKDPNYSKRAEELLHLIESSLSQDLQNNQ